MAVVVVAEDDDINKKQRETYKSEHGKAPNLFVSDFQHKPETHQDFGGDEHSREHGSEAKTEDFEAVDIKFETVDAEQFQHRRDDKHHAQETAKDSFCQCPTFKRRDARSRVSTNFINGLCFTPSKRRPSPKSRRIQGERRR